jgi:hypothetical protein
MKKNDCPFLDSQKRCTHKNPLAQSEKPSKLPDCPFSNPLKCELHNLWLKERKSLKMATNTDSKLIRDYNKELYFNMLESKEVKVRKRKPFFKYCANCDKRFQPSGSGTTVCDKCRKKTYKSRRKLNSLKLNAICETMAKKEITFLFFIYYLPSMISNVSSFLL